MIKGIIALFTSGIIFNPLILLGIGLGFVCMATMDASQIEELFKDYHLYLLALLAAVVHRFGFKKVYKDDGDTLDVSTMIWQTIGDVAAFAVAAVLTLSFVSLLSF